MKVLPTDIDNLRIATPAAENFGDPRGRVDPNVLRAAAWGTDFEPGSRNSIAQAITPPPAAGAPGGAGGGLTPAQQYLQAIGWQGTEQQFYDSRGGPDAAIAQRNAILGGGGGGSVPQQSVGGAGGGGLTPAQQYLQAIGWGGTEQQYYDSQGGPEAAIAKRNAILGGSSLT
jgi:hypothetical protein